MAKKFYRMRTLYFHLSVDELSNAKTHRKVDCLNVGRGAVGRPVALNTGGRYFKSGQWTFLGSCNIPQTVLQRAKIKNAIFYFHFSKRSDFVSADVLCA